MRTLTAMLARWTVPLLLTAALCHAAKPELKFTYEEMRKDFESRRTVEETFVDAMVTPARVK